MGSLALSALAKLRAIVMNAFPTRVILFGAPLRPPAKLSAVRRNAFPTLLRYIRPYYICDSFSICFPNRTSYMLSFSQFYRLNNKIKRLKVEVVGNHMRDLEKRNAEMSRDRPTGEKRSGGSKLMLLSIHF